MRKPASPADPRIEADSVRALYAQMTRMTVTPLVAGAIVVTALWATSAPLELLAWYALVAANSAVRLALDRRFWREPADLPRAAFWARCFAWNNVVNGAIFGSSAIFFFPPDDTLRQMFLMFTLGAAATSSAVVAYYPPAMLGYLCALFGPVFVRVVMEGGLTDGFVTLGVLFVFGVLVAFGFGQARMLRELIAMRRRNLDLIEELRSKTELAEAAQRKAEQASLAKSQFFTAASHDLRQPLHALGLFAAALRDAQHGRGNTKNVDQILSSVDALESLFDELLDISKLDAGYIKPSLAHVPAAALFGRLAGIYTAAARKSGLRLRFAPTRAVLLADSVLLERVLSNLVSNALRYTLQGRVLVGCRRRGGEIALEVWDTGIGIPEHQRKRVFDEFFQIGNPERDRKKGLGLGLATVKRISDLLGYRIEMGSRVGRGTVFRLFVPAGDPGRVTVAPPMAQEEEVNLLAGTVIVLIEDERAVREGTTSVFSQWGCRIVASASADEAAAALAEAALKPDVIVADYRLREHRTGADAIDALRKRFGAKIPALLASGDTTPELFKEARERGLLLLIKPVRAARMRAVLLHLLARQQDAAALPV